MGVAATAMEGGLLIGWVALLGTTAGLGSKDNSSLDLSWYSVCCSTESFDHCRNKKRNSKTVSAKRDRLSYYKIKGISYLLCYRIKGLRPTYLFWIYLWITSFFAACMTLARDTSLPRLLNCDWRSRANNVIAWTPTDGCYGDNDNYNTSDQLSIITWSLVS